MLFSRKAGGLLFVDRGARVAHDFNDTDLTIDDGIHTLDMSAIVPATAKIIVVACGTKNPTVGPTTRIAPVGYNPQINGLQLCACVANMQTWGEVLVKVTTGIGIDYMVDSGGTPNIYIDVEGWFV